MAYTPIYEKPYENGWEDLPSENTPATADILDQYDDTFEHIEEYLEENPIIQTSTMPTASEDELGHIYQYMGETTLAFTQGYFYKCVSDEEEEPSYSWENIDVQSGGGGGTTVVANPTGTPTDDLETVQIGNVIYDIPGGGGGNANIWTGTQAEYEAQASQIADDTVVLITDDEQEVVEGGTIYSEEEQCIGLWLDNKPLYQKTWTGLSVTPAYNSWTNIISNDDNIEKIVKWSALSGNDYKNIEGSGLEIQVTSSNVRAEYNQNVNVREISVLTLQYTKTTDAPLDAVVGKSTMYIASSDCYSTVEKEVGCHVDGKPLYQKTIDCGALPNNATKTVAHGISNIDTIVNTYGYAKATANQTPIPFVSNTSAGSQVALFADATNITLRTSENKSLYTESYVTIQYTKTTDTPGSGQYTPASGKAVHYSTDEQVIGTWIDGKPLYRKSIVYANSGMSGTNDVIIEALDSSIDVLSINCVIFNTGNKRKYILPYLGSNGKATNARIDDNNRLVINTGGDSWGNTYTPFIFTIEYTKTTD